MTIQKLQPKVFILVIFSVLLLVIIIIIMMKMMMAINILAVTLWHKVTFQKPSAKKWGTAPARPQGGVFHSDYRLQTGLLRPHLHKNMVWIRLHILQEVDMLHILLEVEVHTLHILLEVHTLPIFQEVEMETLPILQEVEMDTLVPEGKSDLGFFQPSERTAEVKLRAMHCRP